MARVKFEVGGRVWGKEEGPASFRGRVGIIVERGPGRGEYGVRFDDGRTEYVMSWWLEAAPRGEP